MSRLAIVLAILAGGTVLTAGCNKSADDATPSVSTAPASPPPGGLKKPKDEKIMQATPMINPKYQSNLGAKAPK